MEKDYCETCNYANKCDYAYSTRFCVDCKDYRNCDICYITCKAGHAIECDNGFEPENEYEDEVE